MSPSKSTIFPHSTFEQDFNHDFDDMNSAYKAYEHDDLFQTVSESSKPDRETLFYKASDQVNRVLQGFADWINVPSRLADSIQEIW